MQARDVRCESAALVTNWGWGELFDGSVGCVYGLVVTDVVVAICRITSLESGAGSGL